MNILLFHQHFNTPENGGAIRSYYLATALARKGHRVTMITSCACPKGSTTVIDGVEIIYLAIPYNNRFTFFARVWSFLRFALVAARTGARFRHYDVCYAISVPLTIGLCARWMKWRYGIPYWFEVGDLWPDAPIELGYLRNRLVIRFLFALERSIYRNARGVVALSEPIRQAVKNKVPGSRVEVIPNMADTDFYTPTIRGSEAEEVFQTSGKFVVSYIGALGVANGLDYLIQCASAAQDAKLPIKFLVCGDGAMLESLRESSRQRNLLNIQFTGLLNRDNVREVMSVTDAVLVSYLPAPILETGCPNKYFDGLAAGKLIVVNFGGWIRNEVEEKRCGFYGSPIDPSDFVRNVRPYMEDPLLLKQTQQRARILAEESYARAEISARFAALFASS